MNERMRISHHIGGQERAELYLSNSPRQPVMLDRLWRTGITGDVVEFLINHCRCLHCLAPVATDLSACGCQHRKRYALEVEYDPRLHRDQLNKLFVREQRRIGNRARLARVKAAGGTIDRRAFLEMLKAQENMCFYCLSSLIGEGGKLQYHADHWQSLADGGANTVGNLVLACARCNLKKNKSSGPTFDRVARKWRPDQSVDTLRRIRRNLRQWKEGLVRPTVEESWPKI